MPKDVVNVRVDSSVLELQEFCFRRCNNLVMVDLQDGLQVIRSGAFESCKILRSLAIPATVTEIGSFALASCKELRVCKLSDRLQTLGEGVLKGCPSLQTLRIPSLLVQVSKQLVSECFHLLSLELPEGIQIVHENAFATCLRLKNVAFSPTAAIDETAFSCCRELQRIFPNKTILVEALKHRFDGLPIHKLCYYHSYYPVEVTIRKLLREIKLIGTDGQTQDCLGMTPLHILALSSNQNIESYKLLMEQYPGYIITKDKWGELPIYYACTTSAPLEIIQFLLESHMEAFPYHRIEKWIDYDKMLRCYCLRTTELDTLQFLMRLDKTTFRRHVLDMQKVLYYAKNSSIEAFRYMLQLSLADRLEMLGLEEWRCKVIEEIAEIMEGSIWGEGTMSRAAQKKQISVVYSKLVFYELKEALSLLELYLWKAKMGTGDKKSIVDSVYRHESRVNCGVETVVANVLPFLVYGGSNAKQQNYCVGQKRPPKF